MYQTKAIEKIIDNKDSIRLFTPLLLWGMLTLASFFAFAATVKPWLGISFAVLFLMIIPVVIYMVKTRKKIDAENMIPKDVTYTVQDGRLMIDNMPLDIMYDVNKNEILLTRIDRVKTRYGRTTFCRYLAKIDSNHAQGLLLFLDDNGIPYDRVEN